MTAVITILTLLLVAASSTGHWPLSQTPDRSGLILGRVVDATTGVPVEGVRIIATDLSQQFGSDWMLTDASGQFVLFDLPAGRYRITASKAGYDNGAAGGRWSSAHQLPALPGEPDDAFAQPIVLTAGERRGDLTIRIWPMGVVTGRVHHVGRPVVGAQVFAWPLVFAAGRAVLDTSMPFSARTDDRGVYRIPYLPPGDFIVGMARPSVSMPVTLRFDRARVATMSGPLLRVLAAARTADWPGPWPSISEGTALQTGSWSRVLSAGASAADGGVAAAQVAFHPAGSTTVDATVIRVDAGEVRDGVDIAAGQLISHRIDGRLTGQGPTASVAVVLQVVSDTPSAEFDVALAVTDEAGRFSFAGIPPGLYRYRIHEFPSTGMSGGVQVHLGRAPLEAMTTHPWSDAETWWASGDVRVDGDIEGLEISLTRGARVTGVVRFESDAAAVVRPGAVRLHIEPADGRLRPYFPSRSIDVNERGEFRSVGLAPGRYLIRASQLPAGWWIRNALYSGRDLSAESFLVEGTDIEGVTISMTSEATTITGTVRLGARNQTDADAAVVLFPADETRRVDYGRLSRSVLAVRVGEDGRYTLRGMAAGDYCIVAVDAGDLARLHSAEWFARMSPLADRLHVTQGAHAVVDLVRVTR